MVQTATSRKPAEYDATTRSIRTGNGKKLDDDNKIGNIKVPADVEAFFYDVIKQRRERLMAEEEKKARQRAFINAQADMQPEYEEGSDTETEGEVDGIMADRPQPATIEPFDDEDDGHVADPLPPATDEPQADAETTGPVPAPGLAPGQGECPVQSKQKRKAEAQQERDRSKKAARSEAAPAQKLDVRLEEENGYVDESKQSWRVREGGRSAVDGNQRSCSQDGLVNGAKRLGVPVTKKAVDAATLPLVGDTKVGVIVAYARDELGISMLDTKAPGTLDVQIFRTPGGPEHALLQITDGSVFFTELNVDGDKHIVVYDSGYDNYSDDARGAIIDNSKNSFVKHIDPTDRAFKVDENGKAVLSKKGKPVSAARDVFNSIFPGAANVSVVGAWLMSKMKKKLDDASDDAAPPPPDGGVHDIAIGSSGCGDGPPLQPAREPGWFLLTDELGGGDPAQA